MTFAQDAHRLIVETTARFDPRTREYVPRVLYREGTSAEQSKWLRRLRLRDDSTDAGVVNDTDITRFSRLAIIGNSRSGKSQILRHSYLERCRRFLEDDTQPFPFLLDLGAQLLTTLDIETALTSESRGLVRRATAEHPGGVVLFLDALDEVLLKTGGSAFYNDLRVFIGSCPAEWKIVLACRRALWDPSSFQTMQPGFVVYHCDYLDREAYQNLIPGDAERSRFVTTVRELHIENFLDYPFEGFDLARSFVGGIQLPHSRQEWYEKQVTKRLGGSASDQRGGPRPPLPRLKQLSLQLACIASFGGANTWSAQAATDLLGESQALASGHPAEFDEVECLLQTPLFRRIGDSFSFDHQSFIEYLTASALVPLPLRKQRQLLEASKAGPEHRISMPRRGVAVHLAELSRQFRTFLIDNDPLVAFLAEMPGLPIEDEEGLLRTVLDQAVRQHRAPWWEIPPRGERPSDWLSKHRPRNIVDFVRGYLESPDEIARLWGAAAVSAWGGARELNELLVGLAHDDSQHLEIRDDAIGAIALSGVAEDVRRIYDLLDSTDDQIRGQALDAFRLTEHPTPREFISKLHGGAHNEHLICLLEVEPELYAQALNVTELQEAFIEADSQYDNLGNLRTHLLRGLVRRAFALGQRVIPPSLILKIWEGGAQHELYFWEELNALLQDSPGVFAGVWNLIIECLRDSRHRIASYRFQMNLMPYCTDQIFDLLPPVAGLNEEQRWFIESMLSAYFNKMPTAERLQVFRTRAAAYASRIQLPQRPRSPQAQTDRDLLAERSQIVEILDNSRWNDQKKCIEIFRVIKTSIHERTRESQGTKDIIKFVEELPPYLRPRIIENMHHTVNSTTYCRSTAGTPNEFTITHPALVMPFWVLYDLREALSAQKIAEIILCYGFAGFGPTGDGGMERTAELLDHLRSANPGLWERCLVDLGESAHIQFSDYMEYLISRELDLFVQRCRYKLISCDFSWAMYNGLLNYWAARRPTDFAPVLRKSYFQLKSILQAREHGGAESSVPQGLGDLPYWNQLSPLLLLLREDDDWAWEEIQNRIAAGDVPANDHDLYVPYYRQLQFPLNASRLPALANWYAYVRRNTGDGHLTLLDQILLGAITRIGGDAAIGELRRLIAEHAYPGVEWLSHTILQIEDARLQTVEEPMKAGDLLDYVNREALGSVRSHRDLFEWVCQAIEDIKGGIELRAEQVQGYWNRGEQGWVPKDEIACQNVFWPMLSAKLAHLNIVGVEEKLIAADRADFWIEKPLEQVRLRVVIEMKTARRGYSDAELISPVREQLWDRYLRPEQSQYGIFIVFWFKDSSRYSFPTRWGTKREFESELENDRAQVAKEFNLSLACYVIDATTMPRIH